MKRFLSSKSFAILLGAIALLAVVYIAAGLPSIKFQPAELFVINQALARTPLSTLVAWLAIPLLPILICSAVALLLLIGLSALLDRKHRRKYLIALLRIGIITGAVLFLGVHLGIIPLRFVNGISTGQASSPGMLPPGPATAVSFISPYLPSWVVYLITLVLLLGIAAGIWWFLQRNRRNRSTLPLDELGSIARKTLDDIRSGSDWEDAVVVCYVRMSATVSRRRALSRPGAVTPTEFAVQLEQAGLPGPAVRQLTGLFEEVRYGAKRSTEQDVQKAVECLTTILHACGEAL